MITINVKYALLCVLFIAIIILVIYLIIIAKNLVKTIKETNKILQDAAVVSKIAAEKAVQIDGVVDDVQAAVSDLSKAVRGEQNLVATFSNMIKALGPLLAFFRQGTEEKKSGEKRK